MRAKLVGNGLGCIADIIGGWVNEADVLYIVSEIKASSKADWEKAIKQNRENLWRKDPIAGAIIFWRLYEAGKIVQPGSDGKVASFENGPWIVVVEAKWLSDVMNKAEVCNCFAVALMIAEKMGNTDAQKKYVEALAAEEP
jgi:hypothetical protein